MILTDIIMAPLSTQEVALKVGISKVTLERWLATGKIASPKKIRIGRSVFRNWSERDVENIRKYKQHNYRKGRGRKPKSRR